MTTLARTVLDLAGELSSGEVIRLVAVASNMHATIREELRDLIARHARRRGVSVVRAVLEQEEARVFTRSEAEERVLRLIRRAWLPRPEVNVWIEGHQVDLLWRAERVVVEVDGFAFHSSRSMFESDRRRDAMLATRGFRVLRVTWKQITTEAEAMLVRLALVLNAAPNATT